MTIKFTVILHNLNTFLLDTSNKPKKSSINYNDVLRYVDFSQYDGSEETPPIPAKTPTYRTSSRSRDHHDSKISLSRGSSLGDILESSGAYDGSRFTTVPIQVIHNYVKWFTSEELCHLWANKSVFIKINNFNYYGGNSIECYK